MKVLLIGASGYVGSALDVKLRESGISVLEAPCDRRSVQPRRSEIDTAHMTYLAGLMADAGVIVHCVGSALESAEYDARSIVEAAIRSGVKKIVYMSSMAVYGFANADLDEEAPVPPTGTHYSDAMAFAERELARFAQWGEVVIFRTGSIVGAGGRPWVQRIGALLSERRIGDLGRMGDGWSNIVALDDVCQAVVLSVIRPALAHRLNVFNLAAPDSPRWNTYFRDFALAIDAAPLRRVSPGRIRVEVFAKAPLLSAYRQLCELFPILPACKLDAITPALIKTFHLAGKLNVSRIDAALSVRWTPYAQTVQHAAAWYLAEQQRTVIDPDAVSCRMH